MKKRLLIITVVAVTLVIGSAGWTRTTEARVDYSSHVPVLAYAEILTDPLSGEAGGVVWLRQDLGNKQLAHDFVYGDPRRAAFNGGNPGVTFGVNEGNYSSDANLTDQPYWMLESIRAWDNQTCSNLGLVQNAVPFGAPGVVQNYFITGSLNTPWYADITQVGFLNGSNFPYFAANTNVLGVTFTLFWVDGAGNVTDIDNNGKVDIAFREIYYNDTFEWADNGVQGARGDGVYDFPSVAIHEVGHGFSQAHFGSIGRKDGALFPQPKAVMNAIYGGIQRTLSGNDVGGHCSNWAQWPVR